jgi:hypothetical protein
MSVAEKNQIMSKLVMLQSKTKDAIASLDKVEADWAASVKEQLEGVATTLKEAATAVAEAPEEEPKAEATAATPAKAGTVASEQ